MGSGSLTVSYYNLVQTDEMQVNSTTYLFVSKASLKEWCGVLSNHMGVHIMAVVRVMRKPVMLPACNQLAVQLLQIHSNAPEALV